MNVNKVATALEQLISTAEEIMEMPDAEQVYMPWLYGRIDRPIGILTTEEYKKNIEQLLAIKKELEDMFKRSYYCQITAKEAKKYAETLLILCSDEFKTLQHIDKISGLICKKANACTMCTVLKVEVHDSIMPFCAGTIALCLPAKGKRNAIILLRFSH